MVSAVQLLDTLTRLHRTRFGTRVPVLRQLPRAPACWQAPELRIDEQQRRIELSFRMAGAVAESTRVFWDEEQQLLVVHAAAPCSSDEPDWYAEVSLGSDVEGSRARAFVRDGTLRVVAPRVDSRPVTGLPLLAWTPEPFNGSWAPAT